MSFYDVRWDETIWTNNETIIRFKKTNKNVQRLLKFAKIWKFIIESKPVITFNIAMGIAKYRFNVFFDMSGIVGLDGLAVTDDKILFWSATFEFLINRFNKHVDFFDDTSSESIYSK